MIKKILVGLLVVIVGILIFAAVRPAEMYVSRELVINATPEAIFPFINSSKKSYDWMPWAVEDPGLKMQFTGPEEGVGASSNWEGERMGVGQSEVVESIVNSSVKTKLTYVKPFEMSQLAELSLTPTDKGTLVKWSVSGHQNYFFRLIGVFISCDKMIGPQFEQGLNKLKSLVETK